jgi:hypothetical protein
MSDGVIAHKGYPPIATWNWWRIWRRSQFDWLWDIVNAGWTFRTRATHSETSYSEPRTTDQAQDWRQLERQLLARAPTRMEFQVPGYATC